MRKTKLLKIALSLLSIPALAGIAGAAVVIPGSGDGLLNFVELKIGGAGSDADVNNTSEAENIFANWVGGTGIVNGSGAFAGKTWEVASVSTSTHGTIDVNGNQPRDYTVDEYNAANGGANQYIIQITGGVYLPAGDYTFRSKGDDGSSVVFDNFEWTPGGTGNTTPGVVGSGVGNDLRYENPTGDSNTWGNINVGNVISGGDISNLTLTWFERTGGDWYELGFDDSLTTTGSDLAVAFASGQLGAEFNADGFIPEPSAQAALLALGSMLVFRRRR